MSGPQFIISRSCFDVSPTPPSRTGSRPALVPGLPRPQALRGIDEQKDVEEQAVPYPEEEHDLRQREDEQGFERTELAREEDTRGAGDNIAERVDDRVAVVAERGGRLAVAVDDELGVLKHLPQ